MHNRFPIANQDWSKGWQRASSAPRQSRVESVGLLRLLDDSFSLDGLTGYARS